MNLSPITKNVCLVDGLKHNLLIISQLCDMNNHAVFESSHCIIESIKDRKVLFIGHRHENVYVVDLNDSKSFNKKNLSAFNEDAWIWHKRLGHATMDLISKLSRNDLVDGLPKLKSENNVICDAYVKGKQTRTSFKSKGLISTSRPFELLHMDLLGSISTMSLGGKQYAYMSVFLCTWKWSDTCIH